MSHSTTMYIIYIATIQMIIHPVMFLIYVRSMTDGSPEVVDHRFRIRGKMFKCMRCTCCDHYNYNFPNEVM